MPWLDRLSKSPEGGGKVAAALLSSGEASSPARSVLERSTGRSVIGLDRSDADAAPAGNGSAAAPGHGSLHGIDRLARCIGGLTVGIALGAGAAKGLAHLGVLRVLKENNVPIDYIAGSSIGAIIGALYASEAFELEEMEEMIIGADRKVRRWNIPVTSLWRDSGLRRLLSDPGPTTQFNELPTPFVAVATDLASGREVALRDGLIWRAVQASVSIPGIFPPMLISGHHLVDGGVVCPVPTQAVRDLGADIAIAVDLSSPGLRPEAPPRLSVSSERESGPPPPRFVEVLWRATEIDADRDHVAWRRNG